MRNNNAMYYLHIQTLLIAIIIIQENYIQYIFIMQTKVQKGNYTHIKPITVVVHIHHFIRKYLTLFYKCNKTACSTP
jgi:hypothetical protein